MRKHEEESHENSERWLLSYSDFITLLMVFFVVMYSMSSVDSQKFQQLAESLSMSMGSGKSILDSGASATDIGEGGNNNSLIPMPANSEAAALAEKQELQQLEETFKAYFAENNLSQSVDMNIDERGLVISLKDTILFDSGHADLIPTAIPDVVSIGKIINGVQNYIRIEGHTDNVPIHTSQFNSNWELSTIRACAVVELLIAQSGISPEKLVAVGYADNKPITDNNTEDGKSKNRRVDIIILSSKFNDLENQLTADGTVASTPAPTTP